jgi:hypothetical protein
VESDNKKKNKMGHFEREAIINVLPWMILLLLGLIAAVFGPSVLKLLR